MENAKEHYKQMAKLLECALEMNRELTVRLKKKIKDNLITLDEHQMN